MKTWTLRTRLTLWSSLVSALALIAFAIAAAIGLYYRQIKNLDKQLTADAQVFFAELHEHGAPTRKDAKDALLLLKSSARLQAYAVGPAGAPPTDLYPAPQANWLATATREPGIVTVGRPGENVRLGVFRSGVTTLMLVATLHSIEETVWLSLRAFLLALPAVLLLVGAGSAWLANRALAPLAEMTRTAEGITAARLGARLPQPATNDEIGRHIRVLNAMFDRLQRGFEQATRFTADASHELRTPLTILRGEIEEILRSGRLSDPLERRHVSLLEQVVQLQKITGNLLLLSRFDAGKAPLALERVDLSALVAEAAEDVELLAAKSGLTVHADVVPGLLVDGDEVLLRRLLTNLADNAVRHNRAGGSVRLTLRTANDAARAEFRIANTGAGIPPAQQGELFRRFFRLATDRARVSGGTGLGLSLCREIVVAHGGHITLTRGEPDATEFTVTLPIAAVVSTEPQGITHDLA